jgi:Phage integrase family
VVKLLEIKWAGKATAAKQSRRSIRDINLAPGLLRIGRRVPLNSRADAVLARRGSKRSALVFGTRRWDHYPTAWESAVERAKLVDFHFHDLRHTFASWDIQRGASLQEVTDILGHHSLAMTLRYGTLRPSPCVARSHGSMRPCPYPPRFQRKRVSPRKHCSRSSCRSWCAWQESNLRPSD